MYTHYRRHQTTIDPWSIYQFILRLNKHICLYVCKWLINANERIHGTYTSTLVYLDPFEVPLWTHALSSRPLEVPTWSTSPIFQARHVLTCPVCKVYRHVQCNKVSLHVCVYIFIYTSYYPFRTGCAWWKENQQIYILGFLQFTHFFTSGRGHVFRPSKSSREN